MKTTASQFKLAFLIRAMLAIVSLQFLVSIPHSAFSADACQNVFLPPAKRPNRLKELTVADLLKIQESETKGKTRKQINQMNKNEIAALYALKLPKKVSGKGGDRITSISREQGQAVIESINNHPIINFFNSQRYDQPGVSIGFCFGRATYAHLALLKMGVHPDSIKKIWAVGPMNAGGIMWSFHVATVVRSTEGGWMVIDNYPNKLLNVTQWMNLFKQQNKEHNLRIYFTQPEKFSVSLSKYDRVQMGLDLTADQDWYRNYFVDLMTWFKKPGSLQSMGLKDLRPIPIVEN
ncbi:MAG: hypothetical protein V4736_11295 [Bdellovibrionota bacterium]